MSMRTSAPKKDKSDDEHVPFVLEDYVDNPIALARMKAHLTQEQLAERLGVSQAHVSKLERQDKVPAKLLPILGSSRKSD